MADSKAILDEQLHKKAKGEQTKPLADVIAEWMRAEFQPTRGSLWRYTYSNNRIDSFIKEISVTVMCTSNG